MRFSRGAGDNDEVLFINKAEISHLAISKKSHDLKVTYRDKEYFLDFQKVEVDYLIGFEDQEGNQGEAIYK